MKPLFEQNNYYGSCLFSPILNADLMHLMDAKSIMIGFFFFF